MFGFYRSVILLFCVHAIIFRHGNFHQQPAKNWSADSFLVRVASPSILILRPILRICFRPVTCTIHRNLPESSKASVTHSLNSLASCTVSGFKLTSLLDPVQELDLLMDLNGVGFSFWHLEIEKML